MKIKSKRRTKMNIGKDTESKINKLWETHGHRATSISTGPNRAERRRLVSDIRRENKHKAKRARRQ